MIKRGLVGAHAELLCRLIPKDNDNVDVNNLNEDEDNGDDKDEGLCSGKQGAGELDTEVHGGR